MKTSLCCLWALWLPILNTAAQPLKLDSLAGKVKTYYSPGRTNRAKAAQHFIQDAVTFYQTQFPNKPISTTLRLMDQTMGPYFNDSTGVNVSASTRGMVVPRLLTATTNSPTDTVDIIIVHELGHYFIQRLHQAYVPPLWANEFFASYFAICYLETKPGLSLLPSRSTGTVPTYRSLEDFERLYFKVGPGNYGWYQDQFAKLAYSLYPKFKLKLLTIAIEQYGPTGKKTPPLELLQSLAPQEMSAWLEGLNK